MNVLIVEDEVSLQCFLEFVLKDEFSEIHIADNGQMALDILEGLDELPSLVLMDVLMPVMDGFKAAEEIRRRYSDAYLPIVFLTGVTDPTAFNRCMTLGDDFLTKPVSRTTIVAKVRAHCRTIRLYNEVSVQRDKLKHFQDITLYEHTMAETIFANLMQACYNEASGVAFYTSSFTNFNGDVVLVAPRPHGGVYAMLADATGHGLPAAISSIPATKAFFAMTRQGYALGDIVTEMNATLKNFLPPGMLVAANLLEISANGLDISWWGGGMPDGYLINEHGDIIRTLPSAHMALGAMDIEAFEAQVVPLSLKPNQKLFFFTDGVIEARNSEGKELGEEGLEASLSGEGSDIIASTLDILSKFTHGGSVGDDMSMLEVTVPVTIDNVQSLTEPDYYNQRVDASLNIHFLSEQLKTVNLVGEARRLLAGLLGSNIDLDLSCTILSELLNNALEHGILLLESDIKHSDDGFLQYYTERQDRLEKLDSEAYIAVSLEFMPVQRILTMTISHNGSGFDFEKVMKQTQRDDAIPSGRGIDMIRGLCDGFYYEDEGRVAKIRYPLIAGLEASISSQ